MPEKITNQQIIELYTQAYEKQKAAIEYYNQADIEVGKMNHESQKIASQIIDLMNEEYGWGQWHNVNVENGTFETRAEIDARGDKYVIANPAVRDKIVVDEIEENENRNG